MNMYSSEIKIPREVVGPIMAATIDHHALTPSLFAFCFKDAYDPFKLCTMLTVALHGWGL